ncbi:MAG TPA: DUF3352 domain-containing protein [Terriglobales bacterium]|nr:DUF3352 domain-containing protein [Terriglobales bacterium]
MDQQNLQQQPGHEADQYPVPEATVVPMGEAWAANVHPVSVSPRSKRLRWGIAGAIVVAVVVATAAGALALSGAAGSKSLTASLAPKNSVAFLEVRTDLPGDQHARLADFMSHFPGFKDRAQFDNALDEVLNKLTSQVSPDLRYSSAFKPWMEGEVSIAVTEVDSVVPTLLPSDMSYKLPAAVAIFALKDRAAAESWVTSELSRNAMKTESAAYAGTTLYTTGSGVNQGAYAFTDQALLLGTVDGVKAALDTATKGSLADNPKYQAAMKSLSGDNIARFYVDAGSYLASMLGPGASLAPSLGLGVNGVPAWIAGSVRAESDRMVVDVAMPRTTDSGAGNHASRLAAALPGSTVGVYEMHSIGAQVSKQLDALAAGQSGAMADSVKSIKDALARIGGLDWLGDGVAVVTKDGSTYGGGLVVEAGDAATAGAKAATITNLAALAGGSLKLTSRDETYKGIAITVISIPNGPDGKPVEVAVAAKDNLVVAGYTDAFVKAVIDTTPGSSLASSSDYTAVMAAAGASSMSSGYVNIPALEDQIGQALLASQSSRWTLDYKPYFDHLGGVGYAVVDGNTVILRLVVMAK